MPLNKGIFFALFFLFQINVAQAQKDFVEDIKFSLQQNPSPDFRVDSRHSFVANRIARILGIKAGLDYNQKVKIGLGFNFLWNEVEQERVLTNELGNLDTLNATFKLNYFSPYFEYVFYQEEKWQISVLGLVGVGKSRFDYTDNTGFKGSINNSWVFLWEPYMSAEYKIWKYVGVGAGVGYRLAYSSNAFTRSRLSSPIYILKLKVYLKDLLKDLK